MQNWTERGTAPARRQKRLNAIVLRLELVLRRDSVLSPLVSVASATSAITVSTVAYYYAEGSPQIAARGGLDTVALLYSAILVVACLTIAYAFTRLAMAKVGKIRSQGVVGLTPGSLLPYLLSERRYRTYFVVAAAAYGLLYCYITGTVALGPILAPASGITPPTTLLAVCCGPPLFLPTLTVYVTAELGLYLVPLVLMLLVSVSILVGLNFTLAAFAFHSRARGLSGTWVIGLGAVVGLFTGCPTCAGLFFGGFLGEFGAISFAAVLTTYQPALIALSVPVLLTTLYLTSRSLSKVYTQGCLTI